MGEMVFLVGQYLACRPIRVFYGMLNFTYSSSVPLPWRSVHRFH